MNIMAIVQTWRQTNGLGTAFHLTADPHQPPSEVDLGLNKVSFRSTSRVLFEASFPGRMDKRLYSVFLSE